ncbi:MAG: peptidylprolyl isomerase [Flavobacteriales bacterium]|nr:peptidylprolyl isomerase [Flavobacteriales bacterium]
MKLFFLLALSVLFFSGCSETSNLEGKHPNKFSDSLLVKIYTLADERRSDELSVYLNSKMSSYRKEGVLAFASFGEAAQFDKIIPLLHDSVMEVRLAAVYTLGQSQNENSLDALMGSFLLEPDEMVRGQIIESIGKQIQAGIKNKADVELQKRTKSSIIDFSLGLNLRTDAEKNGWARALHWLHRSGAFDDALMDRLGEVFSKAKGETRWLSAMAMSRYTGTWFDVHGDEVYSWVTNETDPLVTAMLMAIPGKMNNDSSKTILLANLFDMKNDPAVRIAAVRALGKQKSTQAAELLPALEDANDQVVLETLGVLKQLDCSQIIDTILDKSKTRGPQIKAEALAIALFNRSETAATELKNELGKATRVIDKTFYIRAFGNATDEKTIRENVVPYLNEVHQPSLSSAAADALAAFVSGKKGEIDFSDVIHDAFTHGDAGVMAVFATMLYDEGNNFKAKVLDTKFLHDALPKLPLPKEIETYNEIVKAINYLEDKKLEPAKAAFNHPVDWNHVKTIDAKQRVEISTTQGKIIVQLNVEDSPGSVSNFLKLAEQKFFDGKIFHRVVPNFVIQAGCPRGDGWGSTDYTIRSEFGLHNYSTGAVGMASAGPDTESCQWFITHLPTPHLEGRYTIFGYVVEGMDVVNKIGIGDEILSVNIL